MKRCLLFIMMVSVTGAGCQERVSPFPLVPLAAFNQALLREATPFLERQTGIKIRLSDKTNKVDDLSVDFEAKNMPLDAVLDGIIAFIEMKHKVKLKWEKVSEKEIVILLSDEPPARK